MASLSFNGKSYALLTHARPLPSPSNGKQIRSGPIGSAREDLFRARRPHSSEARLKPGIKKTTQLRRRLELRNGIEVFERRGEGV
jgi:hypothetical protein